jgi:hypothetical protein
MISNKKESLRLYNCGWRVEESFPFVNCAKFRLFSLKMEVLKEDIAFVLDQSDIYWSNLDEENKENGHQNMKNINMENTDTNINSLVHQACDVRARLLRAMQCSGTMFDTNMQCVAYILSLKKENSVLKLASEKEKNVRLNMYVYIYIYV